MSALERLEQHMKDPDRPLTDAEREQLRADLQEVRDRAFQARRAGVKVWLSPWLRSKLRMHGIPE